MQELETRRRAGCGWLQLAVTLTLLMPELGWAQFVYVNNNIASPNNSVSAFTVGTSGTLTAVSGSPFLTGGGGGFSPNVGAVDIVVASLRLYAANSTTNTIAAFDINADGSLSTIPGSPFPTLGTRPNGIAISSDGSRLFAADVFSNNVAVFDIAGNGALTLVLNAPFAVANTPIDLEFDSANSLLFASHSTAGVGVYSVALDGSLSAVGSSPFTDAGSGRRGLALGAGGSRLYVANAGTNDVSGFDVLSGGSLSSITGSPFAAGTAPTAIVFHPDLDVLYVSNDGSSDIYVYDIDGAGALTQQPSGSPVAAGEVGTAGMVIDPTTNRLFAINHSTGVTPSPKVSVFDIGTTGGLTAVSGSPFATGASSGSPSSITFVSICPAAPRAGCKVPGKSSLQLKQNTDNSKDQVVWKWTNGPDTAQAEFGLPFTTRVYALCVYDTDELVFSARVAGDATCGGGPCWSLVRTTGLKYKDKVGLAANDGLTSISTKGTSGGKNKSKILVKGKGVNLPDPSLPLGNTSLGVTAQWINSDSGVCFTSTYPSGGISKNTSELFKAKVP